MFKNTFQSGFLSILYSIGSKPLQIWDKKVRNGHIKRITDNDIQSLVLEIEGTNVSTTYITCPADPKKTLGIKLPFLVMIIKNLKKYFTFEVQVLDDKNVRRRFRASNYQSTTRVKPFICTMPMRLDDGWNQIQFNLSDFTRRAYGTNYIETLRVQIHANCRIRRVYFSDRLYSEDELPAEFKLYLPVQNKAKKKDLHSCCTDEDIEAILMVTERCEDPVHLMEVLCHSRSCVVIPLPQGLDLAVAVTAVVSYHVAAYCLTFPSLKVEG
ncbi:cilia and flagella associated protein 20 [Cricetulus griseus]